MRNKKIRMLAIEQGVRLWEVAERLGIADSSLSRKLREELSDEDCENICNIIKSIAADRRAG